MSETKIRKRTFSKVYKKFATEADFLRSIGVDPEDVVPIEHVS